MAHLMPGVPSSRLDRRPLRRMTLGLVLLVAASLFLAEAKAQTDADSSGTFFDPAAADIFGQPAQPEEEEPSRWSQFWSEVSWNGYLKNETAYRFHEPRAITKLRNIAYLNARYPHSDTLKFNFAGWYYYDHAYDLFGYDTISGRYERDEQEPLVFIERLGEEEDSNVAEIRELYADVFLEGADLRVGKQYIIWGVLEGVRIVDEINPMDFREMILPDLLDYRIPLWSAKLDWFQGDNTYQFIWIPDLRFHKPAPRGSEWELLQNVCVGQAPEIICQESEPDSWTIEDSEVGVRFETYKWDTELTLSYFYTWDDFPVLFRAIPTDTTLLCGTQSEGEDDPQCVNPAFFPTYTRIHMFGATGVRQMGRYILKGEFAYVLDKYFGIKNTVDEDNNLFVDHDGVVPRDHIRWGLGIEFNIGGMDIAPGVTQWIILNHDKSMMQDKYDSSVNLFVRKELPAQAAVFQMLAIYLVNLEEFLLKPKMTFQIDDRFQMGVGFDLFFGRTSDFGVNQAIQSSSSTFDPSIARAQFIGNFHNNDRVYMDFKYSF